MELDTQTSIARDTATNFTRFLQSQPGWGNLPATLTSTSLQSNSYNFDFYFQSTPAN
jgi:hypothetical protein